MILEKDFRQQDIQVLGDIDESIDMGVDADSMNHLMMILSSNLYQNPIGSIVREYTSNAIDANVEAGVQEPVIVSLKRDGMGVWNFSVQDFGPGLDDKDFRNIISKYGKSTKKDKEDQLGYYGLGCKSGFSYADKFQYKCVKGGIERKYLLYKSENGFRIDLLFEQPCTDPSGVTVTIPINTNDYNNFRKEIRNQLAYFDDVFFDVEWLSQYTYTPTYQSDNTRNMNDDFVIFREEDFQMSKFTKISEMHLTLGKVNYPIDWKALGIPSISLPVALRFGINSGLFPTPPREGIIWNKATKDIVMKKIAVVCDYFIKKYNDSLGSMESLAKAWDSIGKPDKFVTLLDRQININNLDQYCDSRFKELEIPGIKLLSPAFYKRNYKDLISDYRIVAMLRGGVLNTKKLDVAYVNFVNERNCVIHESVKFSGYLRDYVKTKNYKYFFKYEPVQFDDDKVIKRNEEFYKRMFHIIPNNDLKALIAEYEAVRTSFCKEIFKDETTFHTSDEFEKFKANLKAQPKMRTYSGLNKKKHHVTIAYEHKKMHGGKFFKKGVHVLEDLYRKPFLTVILPETGHPDLSNLSWIFSKQKIRFAKIGVQDLKKIEKLKLHNFMTYKELERTKAFSRLATGLRIRGLIASYDKLVANQLPIIHETARQFSSKARLLSAYNNANSNATTDKVLEATILATAEQHKLWDNSIIHEVEDFEKNLQEYDFLTLLATPPANDPIACDKYEKLVNSLLVFKKMKNPDSLQALKIIKNTENEVV